MADYVFPLPPLNDNPHSKYSTAGDSTTPPDQWLWPAQAILTTPSRKLGMAWQTESHIRSRAVNWAVRISITLQLPQLIIATASAYIHRFYMRKPIQKYPPKVMSATALFLSTKVEEVPRKLEYVVREYLKVDDAGEERVGSVTEDSNEFQLLKQQILYYEDILLRALCFDLAVDHPYLPLVQIVKAIHLQHTHSRTPDPSLPVDLADRSKAKSLAQAAWGFVNDSLLTPLCVVATPEVIAASAFLLAVSHRLTERHPRDLGRGEPGQPAAAELDLDRFMNLPAPTQERTEDEAINEPWWKAFNAHSLQQVHEVANAMLDQYEQSVFSYVRHRVSKIPRFLAPSLLPRSSEPEDPASKAPTHGATPLPPDHASDWDDRHKVADDGNGVGSTTPYSEPHSKAGAGSMDLAGSTARSSHLPSAIADAPTPSEHLSKKRSPDPSGTGELTPSPKQFKIASPGAEATQDLNCDSVPSLTAMDLEGKSPHLPSSAGMDLEGKLPQVPSSAGMDLGGKSPQVPSSVEMDLEGKSPQVPSSAGMDLEGKLPQVPPSAMTDLKEKSPQQAKVTRSPQGEAEAVPNPADPGMADRARTESSLSDMEDGEVD